MQFLPLRVALAVYEIVFFKPTQPKVYRIWIDSPKRTAGWLPLAILLFFFINIIFLLQNNLPVAFVY
jgi:hypothetical protein